ncbi:hypothetical protein NKI38_01235 [Mesorhizobium sp. M0621]|uniref:hypothetical protein n=1 Tax=Mesorhizobium sp. M0621 TaxID=2956974 RepID=UPI003334A922
MAISRRNERLLNRLFTIKADAVFPRHRWNLLHRRTFPQQDLQHGVEGMPLTVADMNKLEQAARISMGEFEDSEASVPPPPVPHASMRILALGLAAVILAVMLFQLSY